jgi:hypothetical protein
MGIPFWLPLGKAASIFLIKRTFRQQPAGVYINPILALGQAV